MLKKKIWSNFQRFIELFNQKIVSKFSKIWVWDPGSEIRDLEKTYPGSWIPDPGVKKAPDPGSGSASLIIPYIRCFVAFRLSIVALFLYEYVGVTKMLSNSYVGSTFDQTSFLLKRILQLRILRISANPEQYNFWQDRSDIIAFVNVCFM